MTTPVLEELLIKIGFKVDQESLEKATQRGRELSEFIAESTAKLKRERAAAEEKAAKAPEVERLKKEKQAQSSKEKEKRAADAEAKRSLQEIRQQALHVGTALNKAATVARTLGNFLHRASLYGVAMVAATTKYTLSMNEADVKTLRFAESTGNAYDKIQQLDYAARRVGSGKGEMLSTLEALNMQLSELAKGEGPQKAIGMLDVNWRDKNGYLKDSVEYLLRIADAYEKSGLDRTQKASLLGELGLSQAQIQLIQKGRSEIVRMMGDAKYTTAAAALEAKKLNEEWVDSKSKFNDALAPLRNELTRWITSMLPKITAWFKANKDNIVPWFTAIAKATAGAWLVGNLLKFTAGVFTLISALRIMLMYFGMIKSVGIFGGIARALGGLAGGVGGAAVGGASQTIAPTAATGIGAGAILGSLGILAGLEGLRRYVNKAAEDRKKGLTEARGAEKWLNEWMAKKGWDKPVGERKQVVVQKQTPSQQNRSQTQNITINVDGAKSPFEVSQEITRRIQLLSETGLKTIESPLF